MNQTIEVGTTASLKKVMSEQDVLQFGDISLDRNPVHFDEEFAATTRFKKRICHGMLGAGLISAVIGTKLPGPGSIYLSQTLNFKGPVAIGEEITATVEVIKKHPTKSIYTLKTTCHTPNGLVIEGEAVILHEV